MKDTTDQQWQQQLTDEQYRVTREKGTEPPFSGEYLNNKAIGEYRCVCCDSLLFYSDTKFDSGCGWPSFFEAANDTCIRYEEDFTHGMHRVEIMCSQCDAHLGHVFEDGPQPTGKRYCLNSVSMKFYQNQP